MQGPALDEVRHISPAGADPSVMDLGPNQVSLGQHSTDAKDIVQSQGVTPSLISNVITDCWVAFVSSKPKTQVHPASPSCQLSAC